MAMDIMSVLWGLIDSGISVDDIRMALDVIEEEIGMDEPDEPPNINER